MIKLNTASISYALCMTPNALYVAMHRYVACTSIGQRNEVAMIRVYRELSPLDRLEPKECARATLYMSIVSVALALSYLCV